LKRIMKMSVEERKQNAPTPIALAVHLTHDDKLRSSIKLLLPQNDLSLDQFCAFAAEYLYSKTALLSECSYENLKSCVFSAARYGFILGGDFTQGDIIVRNRTAKFEVGFRGIRELAFRSGLIRGMIEGVVYEGEKFTCDLGNVTNPISHEPDFDREHEKIKGVYILTIYNNGIKSVHIMGHGEMKTLQAEAKTKSNDRAWQYSPWCKHLKEMCFKTLAKRAGKQIPFKVNSINTSNLLSEAIMQHKEEREEFEKIIASEKDKPQKGGTSFIDDVISGDETISDVETEEVSVDNAE